MKPTIDEAIRAIKQHSEIKMPLRSCVWDLAIQALEEMRELNIFFDKAETNFWIDRNIRGKLCRVYILSQHKPWDKGDRPKIGLSSYPRTAAELAQYLKAYGIDPNKLIKRSWRDVTAGEIRDRAVNRGPLIYWTWRQFQQDLQAAAEEIIALDNPHKTNPPATWRSMGA